MRRHHCFALVAILISPTMHTASLPAQSPATKENAVETIEAKRQARMRAFAASHDVLSSGVKQKARLYQRPIARWSNAARRGAVGGAVHLWILEGRPVATIGLWTYKDLKDSYEYQSLAERPLTATRDDKVVWKATKAGIMFRSIPREKAPAKTKTLRLTQMRKIARERFSSVLGPGTGLDENLRLLPQPIYRYEALPPDVVDGAVFSFATGTDPESLLLLEVRKIDDKPERQWHYAFGSQTSGLVDGRLDDEVVWTSAKMGDAFQSHIFFGQ